MNRFEVIRLFVNFHIVPAAILDFRKCTFYAPQCLGDDEMKLGLKFCENRSNCSVAVRILVIIKKKFILDFDIPVFGSMCLLDFRIIYVRLRFLFSIGNALKVPKIEICIFWNPKRHLLARKHAFWRINRPNRSIIVMCGLFQVTNRKLFINEILRWPPVAILYIKMLEF